MKTQITRSWIILIMIFALLVLVASSQAAPVQEKDVPPEQPLSAGGPFELTWSTVDGGGGFSAGGGYELNGTIGQPDASGSLSGGGYALSGGFWENLAAFFTNHLPLILNPAP